MSVISIPAPVGGINARDSYATMQPTDAVYIQDMVPVGTFLETAPPCSSYWAIPSGACRTLVSYEADSASALLGSFGSGSSWDLTDITNPASPSVLKASQTSGIYVSSMFQSVMILCNGTNTAQVYNGTTCVDLVATGPTLSSLRGVITFKGRAYYWEVSSQSFWYAAAGAYQGTLTEFPLDTLTSEGGKIVLLTTFTRDGGEGADDLFVIVFDTGEMIVYQGDDPSSASAWEMIGKFKMPRPIGARSAARVGGDTIIVTYAGEASIGNILAGRPYPLVSDKVEQLNKFEPTLAAAYADLISFMEFPETESLMLNDMGQSSNQKWVVNSGVMCMRKDSGAWWNYGGNSTADFDALQLTCSCVWEGKTYFGFDTSAIPVYTPMAEAGFAYNEVVSAPWYPVAKNGYAFATDLYGGVTKNYAQTSYNGENASTAYVRPFNGLTGNITMVQPVIGTITGFWTGRDKKRWYVSNIRVKSGGLR
jgi:hypothetical protein